jgi:hypothetical protein
MSNLSKGDLMNLTNNDCGVDSALPEYWLQEVEKLGFNRDEILYSYGYSYKNSSFGKPLNLPLEFIKTLEDTKIEVIDDKTNQPIKIYEWNKEDKIELTNKIPLIDIIKSILLGNIDQYEIRMKN